MITPLNNELIFDMNAAEPKTDRELLLKLDSQIEKLSESIDRFGETLKNIEEKKIAGLEKRITELEKWQQMANGGWKTFTIVSAIIAAVALVKSFFK
jgi:hypothetical protein